MADDVAEDVERVPPSWGMGLVDCRAINSRARWWREDGLTLQAGLQDIERVGDKRCDQSGREASKGLDD